MNAKKIIGYSSICIILLSCIAYIMYQRSDKPTMTEQCFSGSIDACVSLDKSNKQLYKVLEITQQQIAENNKLIKAQASKLLSGSSFQ